MIKHEIDTYINHLQTVCPELSENELRLFSEKLTVTSLNRNDVYIMAGDLYRLACSFSIRLHYRASTEHRYASFFCLVLVFNYISPLCIYLYAKHWQTLTFRSILIK